MKKFSMVNGKRVYCYKAIQEDLKNIDVRNEKVRMNLEVDDPNFWCLVGNDETSKKECCAAMKSWWNNIELPIVIPTQEQFEEIFVSWENAGKPFDKTTGILDTMSREGLFFLLSKHYGVERDYIENAWHSSIEPIAVNDPFEEVQVEDNTSQMDLKTMDNLPKI